LLSIEKHISNRKFKELVLANYQPI